MSPEIARAHDIAAQIAIAELIRLVFARSIDHLGREEGKAVLASLEKEAVDNLTSRRLFPQANDETEQFIKEAAAGWITRLFTSIIHPSDRPNDDGH